MSKITNTLLVYTVVLGLAACAQPKKPDAVVECAFPNSTTAAPLWVCDAPVEGLVINT